MPQTTLPGEFTFLEICSLLDSLVSQQVKPQLAYNRRLPRSNYLSRQRRTRRLALPILRMPPLCTQPHLLTIHLVVCHRCPSHIGSTNYLSSCIPIAAPAWLPPTVYQPPPGPQPIAAVHALAPLDPRPECIRAALALPSAHVVDSVAANDVSHIGNSFPLGVGAMMSAAAVVA